MQLARVCEELGEPRRGLRLAQLGCRAEPTDPDGYWRWAEMARRTGDSEAAQCVVARLTSMARLFPHLERCLRRIKRHLRMAKGGEANA